MKLRFLEVFISKAMLLQKGQPSPRELLRRTYHREEFHFYRGREPHEAPECQREVSGGER